MIIVTKCTVKTDKGEYLPPGEHDVTKKLGTALVKSGLATEQPPAPSTVDEEPPTQAPVQDGAPQSEPGTD